jgi:hypothetical protein
LFSLQKIIVSLIFIFLSLKSFGGDPLSFRGSARESGMGGICPADNSLWSYFGNQAALAENKSVSFGINYDNKFFIRELGTRSIGLAFPCGRVSFGALYSDFGYSDFKRELYAVACGMKLSGNISGGVQIDYLTEKTVYEFYRNKEILTCEAGLIYTPGDNLRATIHIFNPLPATIYKSDLPSELRTGLTASLAKDLTVSAELKMRMGQTLVVRTGLEYELFRKFRIRTGFSSENTSFSFGFGYETGAARVDMGFASHDRLGLTSGISAVFDLKNFNHKKQ